MIQVVDVDRKGGRIEVERESGLANPGVQGERTWPFVALAATIVVLAGLVTVARPWFAPSRLRNTNRSPTEQIAAEKEPVTSDPLMGWRLEQLGGSRGRIRAQGDSIRMDYDLFLRGPSWQTQLLKELKASAGGAAVIRFEVRSETATTAHVRVVHPTSMLEFVPAKAVSIGPEWQLVEIPLDESSRDAPKTLRLDVGRDNVAVEIRAFEQRPGNPS